MIEAEAEPLVVRTDQPFNAETTFRALEQPITPTPAFFVRSNFSIPAVDATEWRLTIGGHVSRGLSVPLEDLQDFGSVERTVTVECAGNGRALMHPLPPGLPWNLCAVSTATFRGVPLRTLLEHAGVETGALQVVFGGTDGGEVGPGRTVSFERALPMAEAMRGDVLVAWEMNGEPLTPAHGFPVRLVVPGYYGVAWVKWLERIEVVTSAFDGHFQVERYVYRDDPDTAPELPVTRMRMRALITSPAEGNACGDGRVEVSGIAWSGEAAVAAVDLSADGGASWQRAELGPSLSPYAAAGWRCVLELPAVGEVTVMARATDVEGRTQPLDAVQNALGYGNNAVHRVRLSVTG